MGVETVTFVPDPPQSGKLLTVYVNGHPKVDLTEGTLELSIKVFGITVSTESFDVCQILKCPVNAGIEYHGELTQQIPAGTPAHVGATVRMTLVNKKKETISCIEGSVAIDISLDEESSLSSESKKLLFEKWQLQFPHTKPNYEVFVENLLKISKHNSLPQQTFKMGMNEFGSMTVEEFVQTRMGLRRDLEKKQKNPKILGYTHLRDNVAFADPPNSLDWRDKGIVSQVKNQGACGSCWAFSAVGSMESAYAMKTGKLIEFSEQELVSCDSTDYGCSGGWMSNAFEFVERAGICSEADYGYTSGSTSARGDCQTTCTPVESSVLKGYVDIPPNEAALMAALVEHGPISVAIEADQSVFQFYHTGVLQGDCGHHLDHGVLLVGYGLDEASELPYWIVKNSWGVGWGESGYVRILRGKRYPSGSECGISDHASYPIY
jgi:C1A family cysteine protease